MHDLKNILINIGSVPVIEIFYSKFNSNSLTVNLNQYYYHECDAC